MKKERRIVNLTKEKNKRKAKNFLKEIEPLLWTIGQFLLIALLCYCFVYFNKKTGIFTVQEDDIECQCSHHNDNDDNLKLIIVPHIIP